MLKNCRKSVKFAVSKRILTGCDPGAVGLRVRAAGGNANNGTNAGAFAVNANNAATNANANYSSPLYRLVNKETSDRGAGPCHLAKDDKRGRGCR
jgi:hypothetical protein